MSVVAQDPGTVRRDRGMDGPVGCCRLVVRLRHGVSRLKLKLAHLKLSRSLTAKLRAHHLKHVTITFIVGTAHTARTVRALVRT